MDAVANLYYYTYWVLYFGLAVLRIWALVDCVTRRAAAFPAADKLTKPVWVAILAISGVIGQFASAPDYPLSLVSTVIAAVYLADVRPAVRQISGGR